MTTTTDAPRRDGSRDGSVGCLVCGAALASTRARSCSRAHQQRTFRLRHQRDVDLQRVRHQLRLRHGLAAQTVYECPSCGERFVGQRRCPECNLFSRAVSLGGHCLECEAPVLLTDLLGEEVIAAH